MLHSNYPKLITFKASVIKMFLVVHVNIYTSACSILVITLASNIQTEVNEKLINCAIGCQLKNKQMSDGYNLSQQAVHPKINVVT